ncbi:MAG: hypothetical protein O2967_14070 [Proteobacteria bacterium]|nr:hypothetical protein [Pseudomonadota bacterium]
MNAERENIPGVAVTIKGFSDAARLAAKADGLANLAIAEYPVAIGIQAPEDIKETVQRSLFAQIVDGLTGAANRAGTEKEATANPDSAVFEGTLDAINQHFAANAWSDGLAIIPPTQERVAAFLRFTDRRPDEIISVLPQANLAATPLNIAANGVMAGCRPEHMPILIAAVQAIGDEHYNLGNIGTTGTLVPYLLINGPIVAQLKIESRGQLISRGPNPSLGRALGLIVRNIAGYRPGRNYLGTFGYQIPFALAENEAESPWPPFHVEQGFDAAQSTVTAGGSMFWGYPPAPHSRPEKSGAQVTLELLCREIYKKTILHCLPEQGPDAFRHMITLLLTPPIAQSLADEGYSKQDVRDYLYENARVTRRELEWHTKFSFAQPMSIEEKVEKGLFPTAYLVGPDEMVRLLPSPDILHLIVCGEPGRNRLMGFHSVYVKPTSKEIELPRNWERLLSEG